MMIRTHDEYGGFLPLELNIKEEYYDYKNMLRFNCAKAAIKYLIEKKCISQISIPYYLCPNVCKMIEKNVQNVLYYKIENRLLPVNVEDKEESCIFLVNYFGIMDNLVDCFASKYKKATVIIDNSHSFYHKPIMQENIYNIYSCKKFFGVPDGAYLIAQNMKESCITSTYGSEYSMYLLQNVEQGTDFCYQLKKKTDIYIGQNFGGMSRLAHKMLQSIDYQHISERRRSNFKIYHEKFSEINSIKCEKESIPYMYPLNVNINIKKQLVEDKIYVPTLWDLPQKEKLNVSLEMKLADNTIFLPLDQRYDKNDIEYIIQRVEFALNNATI